MKNYSEYLVVQKGQSFKVFDDDEVLAIVDERDGYIILPKINEDSPVFFGNPSGEGLADVALISVEHDGIVIEVEAEGETREHFFNYFDEDDHQFDSNLKDPFGNLTVEGELEMMLRAMKNKGY